MQFSLSDLVTILTAVVGSLSAFFHTMAKTNETKSRLDELRIEVESLRVSTQTHETKIALQDKDFGYIKSTLDEVKELIKSINSKVGK